MMTFAQALLLSTLFTSTRAIDRSVEVVLAHHDEDLSWLGREPDVVHSPQVRVTVYHKGTDAQRPGPIPEVARLKVSTLPNVGRESHTYLKHIVERYDDLADWSIFTQAGEPSFGYRGHRDGGGHLVAGHSFAQYLRSTTKSMFTYSAAVHLTPTGDKPAAFKHLMSPASPTLPLQSLLPCTQLQQVMSMPSTTC